MKRDKQIKEKRKIILGSIGNRCRIQNSPIFEEGEEAQIVHRPKFVVGDDLNFPQADNRRGSFDQTYLRRPETMISSAVQLLRVAEISKYLKY